MDTEQQTVEVNAPKPLLGPAEQLMILDDMSTVVSRTKIEKPDTIYFLDKSARPLYWFLRAGYEGERVPQVRFLNIGSEKNIDFESVVDDSQNQLNSPPSFQPHKILVLDEHSMSGLSLERAKEILKKKYNLSDEQITTMNCLSAFPSWFGDPKKLGVQDIPGQETNLLSTSAISKEEHGPRELREEIQRMTTVFKKFLTNHSSHQIMEDNIRKSDRNTNSHLITSLGIPTQWDQTQYLYHCKASDIEALCERFNQGEASIDALMTTYYMMKYNRLHPDDWNYASVGNEYDIDCPSLNRLAQIIIENR